MANTPIYISLYTSDFQGLYHWGIVLPLRGYQLSAAVDIFQVGVRNLVTDDWATQHALGVSPAQSGRFLAFVGLPALNVEHSQVHDFLAAENPNQTSTPLLTGRTTWSCAQWVIRTLQKIRAKGWFIEEPAGNLADRNAFYAHINLKGAYFVVGRNNGITTPDFVGNNVEGVPVLENSPVQTHF